MLSESKKGGSNMSKKPKKKGLTIKDIIELIISAVIAGATLITAIKS